VARIELRFADAARAYERERYTDALPTLRDLAKAAPGASSVRELLGLTYYRLGRWRDAIRELRAVVELTGSVDQHPVLADCERALGNHAAVEEIFAELRRTGAGSDVLAEGRLVMAGSLADRGRLSEAIDLLLPAVTRPVRRPLDRHLRQWYAIGDLYERSGDLPRAREYFMKVVAADPEMSNVVERLASLR
jgi:tetratricopeptide (TPR) repeat protein